MLSNGYISIFVSMIQIKKAGLPDLEKLALLFDAYRVWYRKSADPVRAFQFLKERIENKESVIYIAFDGERMVGFTQLYPLFSSTRMKRIWLLNDLYIEETHRGKGISKQLILAAKELANATDAAGILLETEKSNTIGNQLYPSTGFELERNNFYFWTSKT